MNRYTAYWTVCCVRGVFSIAAGFGMMVLSSIDSLLLLKPFSIVLSLVVLAAFAIGDGALTIASGLALPRPHSGRWALPFEGLFVMALGTIALILNQDAADVHWYVYLAALQAFATALAEGSVARETSARHKSRWCFASAGVALPSSMTLLLFRNAPSKVLPMVFTSYMLVFGVSELLLAVAMLSEQFHRSLPTRDLVGQPTS